MKCSRFNLYFITNNNINCFGETLECGDCNWGRVLLFKMASSGADIVTRLREVFYDSCTRLGWGNAFFVLIVRSLKGISAPSHSPKTDPQRTRFVYILSFRTKVIQVHAMELRSVKFCAQFDAVFFHVFATVVPARVLSMFVYGCSWLLRT